METTRWRLLALAAFVLAALVFAACGDDDDDQPSSEEPAAEVEQFPASTTPGEIQEDNHDRGQVRCAPLRAAQQSADG